jgi:hypothetical protein
MIVNINPISVYINIFYIFQVPGLVNYYNQSELLNAGFRLIFNSPYAQPTTIYDIQNIRYLCVKESIICVGGMEPSSVTTEILRVLACANCLNATTQTNLDEPNLVGEAYWYFTPNYSFGFAPTSKIDQNEADLFDKNSNLRVSWHLNGRGGYRLGNTGNLNSNTNHFKKVFLK